MIMMCWYLLTITVKMQQNNTNSIPNEIRPICHSSSPLKSLDLSKLFVGGLVDPIPDPIKPDPDPVSNSRAIRDPLWPVFDSSISTCKNQNWV